MLADLPGAGAPGRPRVAAAGPVSVSRPAGAEPGRTAEESVAEPWLERFTACMRVQRYSLRTEEAYRDWICRYLRFHGGAVPEALGEAEVREFLEYLAVARSVSASTQNQDQPWTLALVVFLAMIASCMASGISGALIPLTLKRFGFDPATASSIFLTTAISFGDPVPPPAGVRPGSHDNNQAVTGQEFTVLCLNRADGKVLWQKNVAKEIPHESGHLVSLFQCAADDLLAGPAVGAEDDHVHTCGFGANIHEAQPSGERIV